MPQSEGAHIARLDERILGVREDVSELVAETQRARRRLHDLEGLATALVAAQKDAREKERAQYRRMEIRLQALTAVVAMAALFEPFLYHLATGH